MGIFEWLEQTSLAAWVNESLVGYPLMLCMHAIGLAVVVGLLLMVNLRMLNVIGGIPYQSLRGLTKLAWVGFVVNFLSGVALLSARATEFIASTPFLVKIGAIALAMILAGVFQTFLSRNAHDWERGEPVQRWVKLVAAMSIVMWLVAIVAGRLIAYVYPEANYY